MLRCKMRLMEMLSKMESGYLTGISSGVQGVRKVEVERSFIILYESKPRERRVNFSGY